MMDGRGKGGRLTNNQGTSKNNKNKLLSFILIGISVSILASMTAPFAVVTTMTLMGDYNALLVVSMLVLIFLAIFILFFVNHKIKFIIISIVSIVYAGLIGLINFTFLQTMKKLAKSYETTEHSTIFTGTRDFDPTGVDYVFYERLFITCFVLLILIAIISASLFIYRTLKEKRTSFRIVNNDENSKVSHDSKR